MTPKRSRPHSRVNLVALWLHDRVCPCGRRDVARATDGGFDHAVRTQRGPARVLLGLAADPDRQLALGSVVQHLHDTTGLCPAVLDKQSFPDGCGPDRRRHLLFIAAHPQTGELLQLLGLPTAGVDADKARELGATPVPS